MGDSIETDFTTKLLVEKYGPSAEEVDDAIRNDPNFTSVYCGFQHFMQFELSPWDRRPEFASIRTAKRECKVIARKMIARNLAYSKLLLERCPTHVRLSIHPHNNSTKWPLAK